MARRPRPEAPLPAAPAAEPEPPWRRWAPAAAAAAVLLAAALAWPPPSRLGVTYDEPIHLASGYSYWKTGSYRVDGWWHPPVSKLWVSLPMVFMDAHAFFGHHLYMSGTDNPYSFHVVFRNKVPADRIVGWGRFMNALWLLPVGFGLWLFLRRFYGPEPALLGVLALGACPSLLAACVATTDMPHSASAFLSSVAFAFLAAAPGWRPMLAAGLFLGLALASKASGVVLLPAFGLMSLLRLVFGPREDRGRFFLAGAGVLLLAFGVIWAVYASEGGMHRWFEIQKYVRQFAVDTQNLSFVRGEYTGNQPWLYALNVLVKTPLPLLALGAAGLLFVMTPARRRDLLGPLGFVLMPAAAVFAAASLVSSYPVENRYVLTAYPALCALAGLAAGWAAHLPRRAVLGGTAALWALAAAGTWSVRPNFLAYFNVVAGGPEGGRKWFINSNLDWGQGLPALSALLKEKGVGSAYLFYFGWDDPELRGLKPPPAGEPHAEPRQLVAVSVSLLKQRALRDKDPLFVWLDGREPEAVAAHSILVYDVTGEREAFLKLAERFERDGDFGRAAVERAWAARL